MSILPNLLLSTMRSLWGAVTPNIRKVSVDLHNNVIILHFYYTELPTEEEIELSEVATSEVIADFPESFQIECQRHLIKFPMNIEHLGSLVYSRFENNNIDSRDIVSA